jgi:hypothetical protein
VATCTLTGSAAGATTGAVCCSTFLALEAEDTFLTVVGLLDILYSIITEIFNIKIILLILFIYNCK